MAILASSFTQHYQTNQKARDRIFKLKVMEGMKALNTSGIMDNRIYKEGSQTSLHAVQQETGLWKLHVENGTLPPSLTNVQFTNFNLCRRSIEQYFNTRNIEIIEIVE